MARTCAALGKSVAVSADLGGVSVLLADEHVERTASDGHRVLTDMDLMNAILTRHEPHGAVACRTNSTSAMTPTVTTATTTTAVTSAAAAAAVGSRRVMVTVTATVR